MKIRAAKEADAAQMLKLFTKLDAETSFMMMEPGERKISVEEQANRIRSFANGTEAIMAVAEGNNELAGFIVATSGKANRNRHSAYMVLGVQKAYWGQGVGSALMQAMETWVQRQRLHRVEFTVVESNAAARALYKKFGYVEEGVKRDSLRINDAFVNEIYMAKLFNP